MRELLSLLGSAGDPILPGWLLGHATQHCLDIRIGMRRAPERLALRWGLLGRQLGSGRLFRPPLENLPLRANRKLFCANRTSGTTSITLDRFATNGALDRRLGRARGAIHGNMRLSQVGMDAYYITSWIFDRPGGIGI